MRLLVFSDLHGNQYAWRAFIRAIDGLQYDRAVFLGDIFGYYYGQEELLRGLEKMPRLTWLKGNHERLLDALVRNEIAADELVARYGSSYYHCKRQGEWMNQETSDLPYSYELEEDGQRILFCHGTPQDNAEGRLYPRDEWLPEMCGRYSVVICGHTHFRMVRYGKGKLWLNAGSLGQPRDGNHSGYLLFDTSSCNFEFRDVLYDKAPLYDDIERNDPGLEKLKEILQRERE